MKIDWTNLWETTWKPLVGQTTVSIYEHTSPFKALPGCHNNNVLFVWKNAGASAYFSQKEITVSASIGLAAHRDTDRMKQYLREGIQIVGDIHAYARKMRAEGSVDVTPKMFAEFWKLFESSVAYYKLCNDEFHDGIITALRERLDSKHAPYEEQIRELFTSYSLTTTDNYEIAVAKIAHEVLIEAHEPIDLVPFLPAINEIAFTYGPIGGEGEVNLWDQAHVANDVLIHVRAGLAPIRTFLDKKFQKEQAGARIQEKVARDLEIPSVVLLIASHVRDLAHLKYELRIGWSYLQHIASTILFPSIAKRLSIDQGSIEFLTYEEITEGLLTHASVVDGASIAERKRVSVHMVKNGVYTYAYGADADTLLTHELDAVTYDFSGTLTGSPASRGCVRGQVRIVSPLESQQEQLHRVTEGDILVTGMTRPHMLPAMKKAAAFVTDEGGITCHAAIIAREMKKPCVIATKIATKVLKDGDLVEVDADRGVVRKIS